MTFVSQKFTKYQYVQRFTEEEACMYALLPLSPLEAILNQIFPLHIKLCLSTAPGADRYFLFCDSMLVPALSQAGPISWPNMPTFWDRSCFTEFYKIICSAFF